MPREISRAAGATEQALNGQVWTAAWQCRTARRVARTRALFAEGRPLMTGVDGRLRHELRATWLGGDAHSRQDRARTSSMSVDRRPKLGALDAAAIGWQRAPMEAVTTPPEARGPEN